jgi:hypothetical protein
MELLIGELYINGCELELLSLHDGSYHVPSQYPVFGYWVLNIAVRDEGWLWEYIYNLISLALDDLN